jgi:hypothetical protein
VTTRPLAGVPRTSQELAALRARREELSNQLVSASGRRNELARRIRSADGADRAGLEQHMQLLDRRILQLESDIALTGQQLAATPANLLTTSSSFGPGGRVRGDVQRGAMAVGSLFTLLVLAPLAFSAARLMWRRATHPAPHRDTETAQRLARLETAVDTIAIEVERVAEGQRFLTRILAEPATAPRLDVGGRAEQPELVRASPAPGPSAA